MSLTLTIITESTITWLYCFNSMQCYIILYLSFAVKFMAFQITNEAFSLLIFFNVALYSEQLW